MKSNTSQRALNKACLTAGLLILSTLSPMPARADSCESGTKVATVVWEQWGQEIKQGGCITYAAVASILSGGVTVAGSTAVYAQCYATITAYEEIAQKMISKWNSKVGNTWAHLGPRPLERNTTLKGTLQSTAGRLFVTPAPMPANIDEVELKLKKTGGKGKVTVTVCKISANGKAEQLWSFTIEKGDENEDKTWSRSFKNLDGYVLTLHLDGKSLAKEMAYEVTTKMSEKSNAKATVK
jgi:hypothetical protein